MDALPRQGGHVGVRQAAGDDSLEGVGWVDVDVQSDAVQGRSARHLQADRADLAVAASLLGQPNARASLDAVNGKLPDLAHGIDHRGLNRADPLYEVDGLAQANDGVDDDLSGSVPRRGTSTIGTDDRNRRGGNVLRLRVAASRPRRRELRNDECVLAAGEDLLVQGALERVNLRVIDQPLVE